MTFEQRHSKGYGPAVDINAALRTKPPSEVTALGVGIEDFSGKVLAFYEFCRSLWKPRAQSGAESLFQGALKVVTIGHQVEAAQRAEHRQQQGRRDGEH